MSKGRSSQGILTGANEEMEWLLPWWWKNYSKKNSLPVAFLDFGLSLSFKRWCAHKGILVEPRSIENPASKFEVEPGLAHVWESLYGPKELWIARRAWFQKPVGLCQTPFQRTLWIDLDCEIFASLTSLFDDFAEAEVAMVPELAESRQAQMALGLIQPDQQLYNSGVILYTRGSPIIEKWAEDAQADSAFFMGDQDVLAQTLFKNQLKITDLPRKYNWRLSEGYQREAVILHWTGVFGKRQLKLRSRVL